MDSDISCVAAPAVDAIVTEVVTKLQSLSDDAFNPVQRLCSSLLICHHHLTLAMLAGRHHEGDQGGGQEPKARLEKVRRLRSATRLPMTGHLLTRVRSLRDLCCSCCAGCSCRSATTSLAWRSAPVSETRSSCLVATLYCDDCSSERKTATESSERTMGHPPPVRLACSPSLPLSLPLAIPEDGQRNRRTQHPCRDSLCSADSECMLQRFQAEYEEVGCCWWWPVTTTVSVRVHYLFDTQRGG